MNKQQKYIILVFSLLIVISLVTIFIINLNRQKIREVSEQEPEMFTPEFMSEAEKQALDLITDQEIQVLKKDEAGKTEVYRIIRPGQDIINPIEFETIN